MEPGSSLSFVFYVYFCVTILCLVRLSVLYQKMNLTAVKEESEVMERHVEDSLSIIEPIRTSYLSHCGPSSENLNLVDVGSGAGLPGVILAIASPGSYSLFFFNHNLKYQLLKNKLKIESVEYVVFIYIHLFGTKQAKEEKKKRWIIK